MEGGIGELSFKVQASGAQGLIWRYFCAGDKSSNILSQLSCKIEYLDFSS
jgi:hypothetical protein